MGLPFNDPETGDTYTWDQDYFPEPDELTAFLEEKRRQKAASIAPVAAAGEQPDWKDKLGSALVTGFEHVARKPIPYAPEAAALYAKARESTNPLVRGVTRVAGMGLPEAAAGISGLAAGIGAGTSEAVAEEEDPAEERRLRELAMLEGTKAGVEEAGKVLTPLDVMTGAAGGLTAIPRIAKIARLAELGLSAADFAAGGMDVAEAQTPGQLALGVGRMAGSAIGAKTPAKPKVDPVVAPKLGQVAPPPEFKPSDIGLPDQPLTAQGPFTVDFLDPVHRPPEAFSDAPSPETTTPPPDPVQRGVHGVQEGVQAEAPAGPGESLDPVIPEYQDVSKWQWPQEDQPGGTRQIDADEDFAIREENHFRSLEGRPPNELPSFEVSPLDIPPEASRKGGVTNLTQERINKALIEQEGEAPLGSSFDDILSGVEEKPDPTRIIPNAERMQAHGASKLSMERSDFENANNPLLEFPETLDKPTQGISVEESSRGHYAIYEDGKRAVAFRLTDPGPNGQRKVSAILKELSVGKTNSRNPNAPVNAAYARMGEMVEKGEMTLLDSSLTSASWDRRLTLIPDDSTIINANRVAPEHIADVAEYLPGTSKAGLKLTPEEVRQGVRNINEDKGKEFFPNAQAVKRAVEVLENSPDSFRDRFKVDPVGKKDADVANYRLDPASGYATPREGPGPVQPVNRMATVEGPSNVPEKYRITRYETPEDIPPAAREIIDRKGGTLNPAEPGAPEPQRLPSIDVEAAGLGPKPPEAPLPPKDTPDAAVPPVSTKPRVPENFNFFLTEKFGDKPTTSKQRAQAKAEWQDLKEKQHLEGLAESAGIPPDRVAELTEGMPRGPKTEISNLSGWRRATLPVLDNLGKVHPWLKESMQRFVNDAELPAMKKIAETHKVTRELSGKQKTEVSEILQGKQTVGPDTDPKVAAAAAEYKTQLDAVRAEMVNSGVTKPGKKAATDLPKRFGEGWDDPFMNRKRRKELAGRTDYRQDLGVVDDYILDAHRRISELQTFGNKRALLKSFLKNAPLDPPTKSWLDKNLSRALGREKVDTFGKISAKVRHAQAISDLGLAAFLQPAQATNVAIHAGFGRSAKAVLQMAKDYPEELYKAIRSGALAPNITQEVIQDAVGAGKGKKGSSFMWGVPTVDKWTRVFANTAGEYIVKDALNGNKGAINDLKRLGFDDLTDPELASKAGKALSDKALFRSGSLEVPGLASSSGGKLLTQYSRFTYRHSLFVSDIFKRAAKGDVVPLARTLAAAGTVMPVLGEILLTAREGIRETARQTFSEEKYDHKKIFEKAIGKPSSMDEEAKWIEVLSNKRIPWDHPAKRWLQNVVMWGGAGIFQAMLERASRGGTSLSLGTKMLAGPVVTNAFELGGAAAKLGQGEPKYLGRFAAEQVPIVGYPLSKRLFPKKTTTSSAQRRRR